MFLFLDLAIFLFLAINIQTQQFEYRTLLVDENIAFISKDITESKCIFATSCRWFTCVLIGLALHCKSKNFQCSNGLI